MSNIIIYDMNGQIIATGKKFRWAQFRELRNDTVRYEAIINGSIWFDQIITPSLLSDNKPYIIHVKFLIPDLDKPCNHWFTGCFINKELNPDNSYNFTARNLCLKSPLEIGFQVLKIT